jgi:hypothetical protein
LLLQVVQAAAHNTAVAVVLGGIELLYLEKLLEGAVLRKHSYQ